MINQEDIENGKITQIESKDIVLAGVIISILNWSDENNNPAGGIVDGPGMKIEWQNGVVTGDRNNRKGALVEDALEGCINRLLYYQKSKFSCDENERAIEHIQKALLALYARRCDRKLRGVEGKNEV